MWGSKRHATQEKDMEEVRKAMKMLKVMQKRYMKPYFVLLLRVLILPKQVACSIEIRVSFLFIYIRTSLSLNSEVLNDLANVGDLTIPQTPVTVTKRPRSNESSPSPLSFPDNVEVPRDTRPVASSRRFQAYQQAHSPAASGSSRSTSAQPPSINSVNNSNSEHSAPTTLDSFPPLSAPSGGWPSSNTISSMMTNDPFPLSNFTSTSSSASAAAYKPQPFPPLDQGSPPLPNFSPAEFNSSPLFGEFADPSGAYAPSAHSSQPFGTTAGQANGVLDSDTLAMWSFAPSGFE